MGRYPHNPDQHHGFAHSTYNRHRDNTGVSITTRRRPILTMRPGFLTFNDARGSGLRHYPADTHLLAWMEAKGIPFDIVTDEDLDDEGVDLIKPYRAVLTGSHPEYHTPGTLDALHAYTRQGAGRLVYLGGNGFYWRIARDKAMPHLFELRRAEGGIRAWEAQPGEYYHQLDGGLGGLWRRNRRPPQLLVGVGFSGQGLFEGTHYRVLTADLRLRSLTGTVDVVEEMRLALNDKKLFDLEAPRVYIYSSADDMVEPGDVEEHAGEAERLGYVVARSFSLVDMCRI